MKPFVPLRLVTVAICLSTLGCQQSPHPGNPWPKGNIRWAGFGEPGLGKVSVVVDGEVAYPGQYFLEKGANLESVMYSIGGPGGAGDMSIPPQTVKLIRTVNGQPEKISYPIRKMTKEEREAVSLYDGDILYYPTIVF
jgi:hypothetical protein